MTKPPFFKIPCVKDLDNGTWVLKWENQTPLICLTWFEVLYSFLLKSELLWDWLVNTIDIHIQRRVHLNLHHVPKLVY